MDYTCRNTVIQNMKDIGCDQDTIDQFMRCFDQKDLKGQKRILEAYRKKLMNELHESQKKIDLFDYMVYRLGKCCCDE